MVCSVKGIYFVGYGDRHPARINAATDVLVWSGLSLAAREAGPVFCKAGCLSTPGQEASGVGLAQRLSMSAKSSCLKGLDR